tara:strand:+ start:2244 stop:2681 length:438 start_codon:yes stop_codon:yes gene_type:complete
MLHKIRKTLAVDERRLRTEGYNEEEIQECAPTLYEYLPQIDESLVCDNCYNTGWVNEHFCLECFGESPHHMRAIKVAKTYEELHTFIEEVTLLNKLQGVDDIGYTIEGDEDFIDCCGPNKKEKPEMTPEQLEANRKFMKRYFHHE